MNKNEGVGISNNDGHTRRRVLLSAFACSPAHGSECEVGWRWALELSSRYEVVVLTHGRFAHEVATALARNPAPHVNFIYFSPSQFGSGDWQVNSRSYYWYWQLAARSQVRRLLLADPFDLIHHLTWGTYRFPGFLGGLGVPLAWGPLGGGERAPHSFYKTWPMREKVFYWLRDASIFASRWDPFVRRCCSGADIILTKTDQTRDALPQQARAKSFLAPEVGVGDVVERVAQPSLDGPLRLLYAGRLLGGKGIPYVLAMMKQLNGGGLDVQLSIAGEGRLSKWAREKVVEWNLGACVRFLGKLPRLELLEIYGQVDLLVFPSWQDSSGNVIKEALARGTPVLCLDIGGPRVAVNADCALIIKTKGLDEQGINDSMASAVRDVYNNRSRLRTMSVAALEQARRQSWSTQIRITYRRIEERLGW